MTDDRLLRKVHQLSDLELTILLSLVGREHCLLSTPRGSIDDLVQELQWIASTTFGLTCAVADCGPETSLDHFAASLLRPLPTAIEAQSPNRQPAVGSYFLPRPQLRSRSTTTSPSLGIANCVIVKNLDQAPRPVQIQALELLRTRRIFTHDSVQVAPKRFVFVPVLGASRPGQARLTDHLNDFFAIAHWHNPRHGFLHLDSSDSDADETASTTSVVKNKTPGETPSSSPAISESDTNTLAELSQRVEVDVEVLRYQMNIISFLRLHRAVARGITPAATRHLHRLVRCLAPLHNLDYVTPALVDLAARKIYPHRICIVTPEEERSMQWGSKREAVEAMLKGIGPDDVIEDVLKSVTAPL